MNSPNDLLETIIDRTEKQAIAFNTGDMQTWARMIQLDPDFTLMQPFGGEASHSFDDSPEHLAEMSKNFRNGDATIDVAQSLVSDDLIVLVMIERQHAEVHGLPDQDWSLRVTQVYRRDGDGKWRLAHRHADPLVRWLSVEKTASLARGA